jgi:hypothetical protein
MSQRHKQPSPDSRWGRHVSLAQPEAVRGRAGAAETAGQVTADCAAVCCCCSFGLINLLYFCFIKLPTGLVLHSARKFKRRAGRCRKCPATSSCSCSSKMRRSAFLYSIDEESDTCFKEEGSVLVFDLEPSKEDIEFKEEMWSNLTNSGFGRSLSRRYE